MLISQKIPFSKKNVDRMVREKFSLFVLWMISKNEIHGYEIIKLIKEDPVIHTVPSSKIYPILAGLCRKGLITYRKAASGKRTRKIYHITEKGKIFLGKIKEHFRSSPLMVEYTKEMLR